MSKYKRTIKSLQIKENERNKYRFFGCRLRHIMLMRDIRNSDLADAIFVSPSTISGYRTGRRSPDVEQLARIAQKLEVSADYLLGLCDEESAPDNHALPFHT